MGGPYEYKPEPKWYNILWDLKNSEFRRWYLKRKRRDLRMYYKYESHRIMEKLFFGFLLASVVIYVSGTDIAAAVLRWPTEDVNELLKQPVWNKHRSEIAERTERVNKMLEDSNYHHSKNSPSS